MSTLFPEYRSPWETDDQSLLRKHAAEFFAKEATPQQERWAEPHEVDRDFWNKTGDAGLLCLGLPEEFGIHTLAVYQWLSVLGVFDHWSVIAGRSCGRSASRVRSGRAPS